MKNSNTTAKTLTVRTYSYEAFAGDVIDLLREVGEFGEEHIELMIEKAEALRLSHAKKAEYNKSKEKTPKGPSEKTLEKATLISSVLSSEPMTTDEINEALNSEYSSLEVANSLKYVDNVVKSKVVRTAVNSKGLKGEVERVAYSIG